MLCFIYFIYEIAYVKLCKSNQCKEELSETEDNQETLEPLLEHGNITSSSGAQAELACTHFG